MADGSSVGGRFRLYVFDLDGTLIDSRRDLADSINTLLVECGVEALPIDGVGRMVGDGAATLVARAFGARGVPQPRGALERFLTIYAGRLTTHTRPYPGIPDGLRSLAAHATLALLTNKPLASTQTILERLALAEYFDPSLILGGDGPHPRKPDPAGLAALMRSTHATPAATLLVGDSIIDLRTARAAGTAICVARYGFGFEGFPREELGSADFAINSPAELLGL